MSFTGIISLEIFKSCLQKKYKRGLNIKAGKILIFNYETSNDGIRNVGVSGRIFGRTELIRCREMHLQVSDKRNKR